jgi:hypothetical protein
MEETGVHTATREEEKEEEEESSQHCPNYVVTLLKIQFINLTLTHYKILRHFSIPNATS